jgi:L-rhamnose mutarotase
MKEKYEQTKGGGYVNRRYDFPTKIYLRTLDLEDDAGLIARYRTTHDGIWPEIPEGIRMVGILDMQLFLCGNRVVMLVITPEDFDWDAGMAELAALPRQQEWEDRVALIQKCEPGATSAEKWRTMEKIFSL